MSKILDSVRTISRNASNRLTLALAVLIALTLLGTLGYVLIEDMSPIDALYMTVITLSTVGYGEPVPLSDTGRLYTIGLIVLGCTFLLGSALDDAVLARAAIDRAAAVVAAIASDSDNVFIALSAREANSDIAIHARAETDAGIHRLRMSGASQIISPHRLGGQRVANAIVRPGVVEFLELSAPGDGAKVDLEEVALAEGSHLVGRSLGDLESLGVRVAVIAIKRGGASLEIRPGPTEVLRAGDRVVVVGDHDDLGRLAEMAAGQRGA